MLLSRKTGILAQIFNWEENAVQFIFTGRHFMFTWCQETINKPNNTDDSSNTLIKSEISKNSMPKISVWNTDSSDSSINSVRSKPNTTDDFDDSFNESGEPCYSVVLGTYN